ncbi:MAG: phosphatidate cytidylyltransferase [Rhodovibrionaceae bacterium]
MAGGLRTRVLSAAVMAPPVLAALVAGPPYSDILIVGSAMVLAWEWGGMILGKRGMPAWLLVLFTGLFVAGGIFLHPLHLAVTAVGGGLLCYLLQRQESGRDAPGLWLAAGLFYILPPSIALLWLRREEPEGLLFVLFAVLTVWATDIGAYFAGRAIGGWKILPSISPSKTWAGLAGGMLAAAAVGAGLSQLFSHATLPGAALLAAGLAVLAQAGDFLESAIKRHFSRKDASALIPGHGGLLDRVDGLLPVALVLMILVWAEAGLL